MMKLKPAKHFAHLPPVGLLLVAVAFAVLGCGSGKDEQTGSVELNACAILSELHPAEILGEPAGEPHSVLNQHDADMAVSQCSVSVTSASYKSLSLLLKYYRKFDNPETAKDFLGSQNLEYAGVKFTPHEISGLGDVAVSLSSPGGFQLWVFWKKHYRMNISLTEFDDSSVALEIAQSVAEKVMEKL